MSVHVCNDIACITLPRAISIACRVELVHVHIVLKRNSLDKLSIKRQCVFKRIQSDWMTVHTCDDIACHTFSLRVGKEY
jgi:hypothetical protein